MQKCWAFILYKDTPAQSHMDICQSRNSSDNITAIITRKHCAASKKSEATLLERIQIATVLWNFLDDGNNATAVPCCMGATSYMGPLST